MKEITYMTDFVPVRMLALAEEQAARFAECLESCEVDAEGVMRVDAPGVLDKLIEHRMSEMVLALTAFEAYLGYFSAETARRIEAEQPGIKLSEYMETLDVLTLFKHQSSTFRRHHELIIEENGKYPISRFLTRAQLTLMEKFIYWPMIRSRRMLSFKDGYVKKMLKLLRLSEELVTPATPATHDMGKACTIDEIAAVRLHHRVPEPLTPGEACADQYVIEAYGQEYFMWDLLHCYPAREVQEGIQYLHRLDHTPQHVISVMRPALLVDEAGKPAQRPVTQYIIEFGWED